MKKPHFTTRYARYRLKDPKRFMPSTLRTQDIGRKGHTKRIAGRLKSNGKWATQALLVTRTDYKVGERVVLRKGRPVIVKAHKRILK